MADTKSNMDPIPAIPPKFTANYKSEEPEKSWGIKKLLIGSGIIIFLMIFWMWLDSPSVVTVTGSGEVSVPATNATVSLTLSDTDDSIASAVASVQSKVDAMKSFLESTGIADSDIAVSQVTAVPSSLITQSASGYQATVSMAAKTIHVSNVSNLVSDLYTKGALVVAQPVLSVENETNLNQQAFDSALSDANSQAAMIGNSNWKFIRKIISISQVSSPTTSTSTTTADTSSTSQVAATNGVFKVVKAVSVSYKMW